jgi:7-carboxy-7-deazaguanine synthase
MGYTVKELFFTLQGEGAHAGRAAVFCRFAGCNLWSGRESDRARAVCTFCDTDFVGTDGPGGGRFKQPGDLAERLLTTWNKVASGGQPYVVFTGGEPLLQIDAPLIEACHERDIEIAIETNGTLVASSKINWICVSPKSTAPLCQKSGNELKLVFPQEDCPPSLFEDLSFQHFFLQPMDGPDLVKNIEKATAYCMSHPRWRLSLQTHKMIGIP